MSKSLILSLGGLGVGGAGMGGLLVLRPWEYKVVTFSDKYKYALLDISRDSTIWGSKYNSLKTIKPKHPKLVLAYTEATKRDTPNEQEAKRLMRDGCKAIYESAFEDSEYKVDFKNYCSFNNGDKIGVGKVVVSRNEDLAGKWTSFSQKVVDQLYEGFKTVNKPENGQVDETWKGAMLTECKRLSSEIFEGVISDFVEFCSKQA